MQNLPFHTARSPVKSQSCQGGGSVASASCCSLSCLALAGRWWLGELSRTGCWAGRRLGQGRPWLNTRRAAAHLSHACAAGCRRNSRKPTRRFVGVLRRTSDPLTSNTRSQGTALCESKTADRPAHFGATQTEQTGGAARAARHTRSLAPDFSTEPQPPITL